MNHAAAFMRQDNEHEQDPRFRRRNREEIDRNQIVDVILQEGSPRLGRRRVPSRHQAGNRPFRNPNSQFEQFPMNAGCAPTKIRLRHRLHELSNIGGGSRPTGILAAGKLARVPFEPCRRQSSTVSGRTITNADRN